MINKYYAKKFCKEDISKIENYDKAVADTTQVWHCHHRTAIWWNCSKKDLNANECYYNRKACELIFLTPEEHKRLHNVNKSDETRRKMSESLKGHKCNAETKRKISDANKGKIRSEEQRNNISTSLKGRTLSEEHRRKIGEASKGRKYTLSEETRKKMSEARKKYLAKKKGEI